jgi:hypothetical protein
MKKIVNIIKEEIESVIGETGVADLSKIRLNQVRKEVKKIDTNFDVSIDTQGSWKAYWLIDKTKTNAYQNYELIVSFYDEYHNPIGAYSEVDLNRMIEHFKKIGNIYLQNGRKY